MELKYSIQKFLRENVCITKGEKILVIHNRGKDELANNIKDFALLSGYGCNISEYESFDFTESRLCEEQLFDYNIILTNTDISLFHNEIINSLAKKGKKIISLTGADINTFIGKAAEADFIDISTDVLRLTNIITNGKNILIESDNGTFIEGNITNRIANGETGINSIKNPSVFPDIEVNTSIIEAECNGKLCIDLSMTKFGKLAEPLYLIIENGKIKSIEGLKAKEIIDWMNSFNDPNIFQVAEFGFGLNPKAEITGNIIEDEAKLGTAHIGFGNNLFMGGKNKAKIHFDMVFDKPRIYLDKVLVINATNILI